MSNDDTDRYIAEAHSKVAKRNAEAAIDYARRRVDEAEQRLLRLEKMINSQATAIADLERKYNLLLTSRFSGGSTSE